MILRSVLLWLSRQRWLGHWIETSRASQKLIRRFIAGRTLEEGLGVCRRLKAESTLATLDILGENVTSAAEARKSAEAYQEALRTMAAAELAATVSIKLTQFGLDVSEADCHENVMALAALAASLGTRVEIDMESSGYVDRTLSMVRSTHRRHGNVRAVIQAYLFRSADDIAGLCRDRIPVRLCKGAYLEPPEVAFPNKGDVDRNYLELARRLVEDGVDPAFATHDERMLRPILESAGRHKLPKDAFEIQMLYGIRRDIQRRLIAGGYRLRLYVPYGVAWYPYLMRRLGERPANLKFLLRSLLRA